MKRFIVVVILITSFFLTGCSSSQEKASFESTGNTPSMNVAGEYELEL